MSAGDELWDAVRRERADKQRADSILRESLERSKEKGRRLAFGFIDLMTRNGISPEPVYLHTQIDRGGNEKPIEQFRVIDRGWVISCATGTYGGPIGISYLRPDGKSQFTRSREMKSPYNDVRGLEEAHPCRGLLANGFGGRVLTIDVHDGRFEFSPGDSFAPQSQYIEAAQWYL